MAALEPKKRGSLEDAFLYLGERTQAHFFWPRVPQGDLARAFEQAGCPVEAYPQEPAELVRRLRALRIDLVHFHFFRPYDPLVRAARQAGCRTVITDHVALRPRRRAAPLALYRRLRGRASSLGVDLRICVSRFVAETVAAIDGWPAGKSRVILNGIDLARFGETGRDASRRALGLGSAPLVACVARCVEEKGVETLVRAAAELPPGVEIAIAGDGALEKGYRALSRALGVSDRIRFLGLRNDVERLLAAADVVVVPSHVEEACPLAVEEAMAAGRPLVATGTGGTPELARNGEQALLVPPRDPGALAHAVRTLFESAELRQRLGRAARERASASFGLEPWYTATVAAYAEAHPALALP